MAISFIAQPNRVTPVYNPVVWVAESTEAGIIGFRYVYKVSKYNGGPLETLGIFRVAPDQNGMGVFDMSKILQSKIDSYCDIVDTSGLPKVIDDQSNIIYVVECLEEYPYYESFPDYEFGGYWVRLPITSSDYNAGDLIYIQLDDQSITDSRAQLNGYHTVVTSTSTYIEIDIIFSTIGSGPLTPGKAYYADRRKVEGDSTGEEYKWTYNQAVSFKDFPIWEQSKVLPTLDEKPENQGDILTNSPNYFSTGKDKDKYIIKPYQELYWNAWNYTANDFEGQVAANTLIVQNEFGDRWMMTDLENWNEPTFMWQFNASPDSQSWINITPNFTNTGGYQYGFNPYTHITPDGNLRKSRYLDYWTTFEPGVDSCDLIQVQVTITRIALPPMINNYGFRPYGAGFNGRRIYKGQINGIECILFYDGTSQWQIKAVNLAGSGYSAIPALTSNTSFGIASASSNNADAYKVFDRVEGTYYNSAEGTGTCSITYVFPVGFFSNSAVLSYQLNKGFNPSGTNLPTQWRVRGSQDGVTWTTLHTVTGNTSQGIYNSTNIYNGNRYHYIRLDVEAVFAGTEVRIWDFSITDWTTKATMSSSNNCPISGGFLIWNYDPVGTPNFWAPLITGITISTTAIGSDTFPTLKRRRVFLDYGCEINSTQLLFLDRAGSYSTFLFPLRREEKGSNQKLSYKNRIGSYNDGEWNYNTYDSETTVFNSTVEKMYTLTTDWLNTGMSDYFEELITSPEVYIKLNSEADTGRDGDDYTLSPWLACTVMDSDFVNPKQKNKRLINRTITVKLNSNNPINI